MDTITILGTTHDVSDILTKLAPYGDVSRGLRKSRPKNENGLVQYVWRYVRFHSGQDTHIPVTCDGWLRNYLKNFKDDVNYTSDMTQASKDVDPLVTYVCDQFGLDDTKAARRWSRAGLL